MSGSASKAKALTPLAQSQNNFTRDLYKQLSCKGDGNLFFSPFSVMAALCMTLAGAKGRTEQQMCSVMHLTQDREELQNDFLQVIKEYQKESQDYELHTSNNVYISNELEVLAQFIDTLTVKFLSASKTVDFSAPEDVRKEINAKVEEDTRSRIKDIIPPAQLNSATSMVLVNAVYFKGFWRHPFEEDTYGERFWLSEEESIKVPMMHLSNEFRRFKSRDLKATLLALDYIGSRLSMVIILPEKRGGLSEVESKISTMNLGELHQKIYDTEEDNVKVTLPKFKLEESLQLENHLIEMGMPDLFDASSCDLSGITGSCDLSVTRVIHKAFLDVNEKGSEAAAATVVEMDRELPPTFKADHPFLFFIRDWTTGMILFCGRL